jgi:glycosyltransferase involved in cell wall biosynthesis
MTDPRTLSISVVMPVRNVAPFLGESIRSILDQSFRDFEFVILDDASDDASPAILERLARIDPRIRLLRSEQPLGVVGSSNRVVTAARAPIIARMDADDVSHPQRLARQIDVLYRNPDIVAVGTLFEGIDTSGARVRPRDRWRLLGSAQAPPFPHGSSMFRRSVFDEVGGYREACAGWEDQDLFLRMAAKGTFVVLPEALYRYRYHGGSTTTQWNRAERERIVALRSACMAALRIGRDYDELLASGVTLPATAAGTATAVRYEAGMRLWAGDPPDAFRPLVSRSTQPTAFIWASWASVHPASLRLFLRALIRIRDLIAAVRIRDGNAYRWRSRSPRP